jgi:hypothetical protein
MFVVAVGIAVAAAYYTLADDGGSHHAQTQPTLTPLASTTPGASGSPTDPCSTRPVDDTARSRVPAPDGRPRAVILDEAGLTAPDQEWVETSMALLQQAGYTVDYYAARDVTVDLYKSLGSKDYGFIILRSHSAALFDDLVLFTDEVYSETAHVDDQQASRLVEVHWNADCETEPRHFGIMPKFIEDIDGTFNGATVLITGCWGMQPDSMAAAFAKKGASLVVGWDGLVRADHTDTATERLLQHLLIDRLPPIDAVAQTTNEVGPDPDHGSTLRIYSPSS